MAAPQTITIVGGGLAGLTLGIGLRQRQIPVVIWEAGQYPRHRVCGEFVSGSGQLVLERLGLRERFEAAGAVYAHTVRFICGNNPTPVRRLPVPALCLSRYTMDALLAARFQELGGELQTHRRWSGDPAEPGLVQAGGRRPAPAGSGPRWFGAKAHVPAPGPLKLDADLEMHISPQGYVGVNVTSGSAINVCGLLRTRAETPAPATPRDWLRGTPGSSLAQRLAGAEFAAGSFCSVGGLSLQPQRAAARVECCIGDRLTMTPPVTGNGMSMAFEAAEAAVEPLVAFAHGHLNWAATREHIARECDRRFSHRLAWARRLQWLMTAPLLRTRAGAWLLQSDTLWQLLFSKTR
ncbi:MAG TPA: hypothetical protein VL527_01650 [Dongiaceae bacterium]|nr:hypothetical protein [Dongiaceae bacterium]